MPLRRLPRLRWSLLLLGLVACVQEPQVPRVGTDPVSIELAVSTQTLARGAADTIRVTVVNNFDQGIRISFANVCQVFVTVRNEAGTIVTPRDGRPQCLPVQSQLTLAARARQVFTTVWAGGYDFVPPGSTDRVPPGSYFVSAELIAVGYSTLAPAFKVDVLP